jgi:CRP-like cAMP-binding protein
MVREPPSRSTAGADDRRVLRLLLTRLKQHSSLSPRDEEMLATLRPRTERVARGADLVRQGDKPNASIFVLAGMIARYHTVASGERQYLSLHIVSDLPDLQSLLLGQMDHAVCAIDDAEIALFPHEQLRTAILQAPGLAVALWRETLLDAAVFRQAITTNGTRKSTERVAHLLCEQYVRARQAGIAAENACSLPLNQHQIGQMLGLSIVTVNRALQQLRLAHCAELSGGTLKVRDWARLQDKAAFDPTYLHLDLHASAVNPPHRRREQA